MGARTVDEETIRRWISENSPSPGGGSLQSATVELTDAQIKALPTTPIELVAAPGAGKLILPISATFTLTWAADYTNINAAAILYCTDPGDLTVLLARFRETISTGVSSLLAFGASCFAVLPQAALVNGAGLYANGEMTPSDLNNAPLQLKVYNAAGGNFTGGNAANTLKVTVYYVEVDL